jgi:hypothetical protein
MTDLWFPEIPESKTEAMDSTTYPENEAGATGTVEFSETNKKKIYGDGTAFLSEINVGDWVLNTTDDIMALIDDDAMRFAGIVKSIESDTELTLKFDFPGTTGSGKSMWIYYCENDVDITGDLIDISGG